MASEKQSQKGKSSEISMEQRMKNRERQRRYRERKRQAANASKALEARELTPQSPPAPSLPANAAAVPPRRNWKKEARMAHLYKKVHEVVIGLPGHQASGSEPSEPEAKDKSSPNPPARKDWKVAARNKNKEEAK